MWFIRFIGKSLKLLILVVVFIFIAGYFLAYSYARFDISEQTEIIEDFAIVSDNFYTDNKTHLASIDQMQEFISCLPSSISDTFRKEWKVVVSSKVPAGLLGYMDDQQDMLVIDNPSKVIETGGYSNWHLRIIYVKAYSDPEETFHVFLHEMGHFFDYEFGCLSLQQDFRRIYSLYANTFHEADIYSSDNYGISSPAEFWATIFKEYFLFPEHLTNETPEIYSFFQTVYQEVVNNVDASNTLRYDLESALLVIREQFVLDGGDYS